MEKEALREKEILQENEERKETEQKTEEVAEKPMTHEEIAQLVQAEAEKLMAKHLQEQKQKTEKPKPKTLGQLANVSKEKSEQEIRIELLEEQLAQYKLANTKAEVSKVLSDRDLDANLVDLVVVSDDAEECIKRVDMLDKIFKKMIQKDRASYLKSDPPKSSQGATKGAFTREEFKRLSLDQQQKLYEQDRALYLELTKRG